MSGATMTTMRMSIAGAKELAGHEAIVLTRYLDSVGVWTIGIGHTAAAGPPDPDHPAPALSLAEAFALFRQDLATYEADVNAAVRIPLAQHEFDALVSFHFNTGRIATASLTASINAGNTTLAATQFMNWKRPAAIIPRRRKEQLLFRSGVYSNAGKATLYPATAAGAVQWSKGKRVSLDDLSPS
jgi:lysozyme